MNRILVNIEKSLKLICCSLIFFAICNSIASAFISGQASFFIIGMTIVVTTLATICLKTQLYKKSRLWIMLFILGAFAKIFISLYVHADIISDMKHCLVAAQSTMNGDLSWQEELYFIRFAYQIPFVLYEALILKTFKTIMALYIANALLSIATAYLIKCIVTNIFKDECCSWLIASIYMMLPSTFMRVSVLYNQILGGFFLTLGLYSYILKSNGKRSNLHFLLSGLFLGLGYIFRQDVAIVCIAIICVELFSMAKIVFAIINASEKSKRVILTLTHLICFIIGILLVVKGLDYALKICNLAKYGIRAHAPLNTIIQGWTPEANGSYSDKYTFLNAETENMRFIEGVSYVLRYISNNENMGVFDWVLFSLRKFYKMWGSVEGAYGLLKFDSLVAILRLCIACMEVPLYCGIMGFALYGVYKGYNNSNNKVLLFSVCMIGYYIAYFIVEVKPRYRFDPIICLLLLASFGVLKSTEKVCTTSNG